MWEIKKRISKGDYYYTKLSEHPHATQHGYVLEHRIVMENHLGRLLDKNEEVHHLNKNTKDNRVENLQVLSKAEHQILHCKERTRKWVLLKCPWCNCEFEREYGKTHLQKGNRATFCSRKCNGQFGRYKQLHGLTPEMENAVSVNLLAEFRKKWSEDNAEETFNEGSVETKRIPPEMVKS